MKKKITLGVLILLFVVYAFDSYAYITPGEGSDFVQIILNALAIIGKFLKSIYYKIIKIFKK